MFNMFIPNIYKCMKISLAHAHLLELSLLHYEYHNAGLIILLEVQKFTIFDTTLKT